MTSTNIVKLPSSLDGHARKIQKLMADWTKNTIDIGKELIEAQENFPLVKGRGGHYSRPGWEGWCKTNLNVSQTHVRNLIRIAKKFGSIMVSSKVSQGVLVLLARDNTPESARHEIIGRIERGEKIERKETTKIINEHKFPKPSEANKQAKETGQPVQASDGYIYFGASKDEAQAIDDRRAIVYGVKDAIETLSEIEMTPLNFIKYMLSHQRWDKDEEKQIEKARLWLNDLAKEWNTWEDK